MDSVTVAIDTGAVGSAESSSGAPRGGTAAIVEVEVREEGVESRASIDNSSIIIL